ncbi:MAG: tetratricopeptide repeat protein [bacterium]
MSGGERAAALALLLVTALAYAPVVGNQLVWDDRAHITLDAALDRSGGRAVGGDSTAVSGRYFRPLIFASYAIERRVWGIWPPGFHLTNLALHLGNVALLLVVARRSGIATPFALAGAALFALHPLQTEAVAYVSGRTDLLVASGALLSCLALLSQLAVCRRGLLAGLAGVVAMASKESGFALVPLWLWLAWRDERSWPARAWRTAPGLLVAAALLTAQSLLPGDGIAAQLTLPTWRSLAAAGWALCGAAQLLIWPAALQVDRLTALPDDGAAIALGLLALLAALTAAGCGAMRRGPVGWWSAWTLAFVLPVANLVVLYPAIAGRALFTPEHNLYVPLAGIGMLVAVGIAALWAGMGMLQRRVLLAFGAAVAISCAVGTARRVRDWHDEERLFGGAVAAGAASPRVWFNYGVALLERGAFATAAGAFEGAVARAPTDGGAWANLAVARQQAGDLGGAADAYARAIALTPDDAQLFENLGTLHLARGDAVAAQAAFTRAVGLDPTRRRSHQALAALQQLQRGAE